MTSISSPSRLLLVALLLGWCVDQLFYGKLLGVSVPLFVLMLLAALYLLGRLEDVRPVKRNLWLMLPLAFFSSMVFVRAGGFITLLNVLAVLALLALLEYFYAAGRIERLGLIGYWLALLLTMGNAMLRAGPVVGQGVKLGAVRRRGLPRLMPMLRGLVIALPVLIVFTCLLASADMIFANYLAAILRLDFLVNLQDFFWQAIIVMSSAWLVAGGLAYALSRRTEGNEEPWESALARLPRTFSLGFVESATVMVLVDVLFLLFGLVQFAYLFGGKANIRVEGFTYAEYARRGFFELLAVALLTLGLILGLHRLAWRETRRQSVMFNLLGTVMVALVMVLLASAFFRMTLYEDAYGYTQLRLYAHVFEIWLAAAFIWLLATLWVWPNRFAIGAFVALLGFLATLNLINPDAFITQQNLARYQATGKLDAQYLTEFSDDAVPALAQGLGQLSGDEQGIVRDYLQHRLESMEHDAGWREWPSFNLARWQAYDALIKTTMVSGDAREAH